MSTRKLCALIALLALVAFPAHAEDGSETETTEQVPLGAPPRPGGFVRPDFYQNAIERAETVKENLEDRAELFRQQMGIPPGVDRENFLEQHPELRDRIREHASTTKANILERRGELFDRMREHASSTQAKFLERREFLKENWEERKANFASTTDRWRAAWGQEKKAFVAARAEHAADLLDTMLARLAGIADRIEERIASLSSEGVDTSEAENALVDADAAIADAEAAIEEAKAALQGALESETPGEQIEVVKPLMEAAKAALRAAHEALKAVALALPKPPGPEGDDEPVTP